MVIPSLKIRSAVEADAPALLEIYRPFVEHTAVSFETEPPSTAEFADRIAKVLSRWQWLVAEQESKCVGYAYGYMFRERAAYKWSVEVSAYLDPAVHRQGIGRALYERLFEDLAQKGYCSAYAGIALPNEGSVALHLNLGFELVGVFKAAGHKFGKWHDVAYYQKTLRDSPKSE